MMIQSLIPGSVCPCLYVLVPLERSKHGMSINVTSRASLLFEIHVRLDGESRDILWLVPNDHHDFDDTILRIPVFPKGRGKVDGALVADFIEWVTQKHHNNPRASVLEE